MIDPEQVHRLTGRRFSSEPAVLHGYERVLPAEGYPYVRNCRAGRVDGLLLRDLDPAALRLLDLYEGEGDLYLRRTVAVRVCETDEFCAVYVANPDRLDDRGAWKPGAL